MLIRVYILKVLGMFHNDYNHIHFLNTQGHGHIGTAIQTQGDAHNCIQMFCKRLKQQSKMRLIKPLVLSVHI